MRKYYIYGHYLPDGSLFYIGKGSGKRAWRKKDRNPYWKNVVNLSGSYSVKLIKENLTEDEAFKLEVEYIKKFGRRDCGTGCLVNLTDGGEGPSGHSVSEQHKEKLSSVHKNNKYNQGRVAWNRGLKTSEEIRKKQSEAKKGKPLSSEHREKLKIAWERRKKRIKKHSDSFSELRDECV